MWEARDRIRAYERRDDEKIKTDKAKNDFESIIYALRDWLNEEHHQAYVKNTEIEEMLTTIAKEEEWLIEGEGDTANLTEYQLRHGDLNRKFNTYKSRKSEHGMRDDVIKAALLKLEKVQDNLESLAKKKSWITEDQKLDVWEKLNDTRDWLGLIVEK